MRATIGIGRNRLERSIEKNELKVESFSGEKLPRMCSKEEQFYVLLET